MTNAPTGTSTTTATSGAPTDDESVQVRQKIARAKSQHRVAIWTLIVVVAAFLIVNTFFQLPHWALVTSYVVLFAAAVGFMITTMTVMINKSPGAHPQQ